MSHVKFDAKCSAGNPDGEIWLKTRPPVWAGRDLPPNEAFWSCGWLSEWPRGRRLETLPIREFPEENDEWDERVGSLVVDIEDVVVDMLFDEATADVETRSSQE